MKTALMIFAAIGVMLFDITMATITFCWICGALDIDTDRGIALTIMWMVGWFITAAIGIEASEEEWW